MNIGMFIIFFIYLILGIAMFYEVLAEIIDIIKTKNKEQSIILGVWILLIAFESLATSISGIIYSFV